MRNIFSCFNYCCFLLIHRAALVVREDNLGQVLNIVKGFSMERIYEMRRQVQFYWENYFKSIKDITLTTLQIINDRIFPYAARKYDQWNEPPSVSIQFIFR